MYLQGELGAGKTTLARGLLQALGVAGTIRSPSYTLVENYDSTRGLIWHADLYRLTHASELGPLGLNELPEVALLLVEWPENGQPLLLPADLTVSLHYNGQERLAVMHAGSERGGAWLAALQ
jgi:tRNA threonylcarbamoyladenosine biosynthesis protein TsaE